MNAWYYTVSDKSTADIFLLFVDSALQFTAAKIQLLMPVSSVKIELPQKNKGEQPMKKLRIHVLAAFTVLTLFSFTNVYAHKTATPAPAAHTAAQKLGRGLAGMTTGFLELPGNIVKETRAKGAVGFPIGLATGLGMLVTRELVGVYEFISAPFPVPAGFRPILTPEYPWDYFE